MATYLSEPVFKFQFQVLDEALFEQRVVEMRAAQRRYFRERTPAALLESKRLEKEVDQLLKKREEKRR